MSMSTQHPAQLKDCTFLSAGKDTKTILKKIFVESPAIGEAITRLLTIEASDCLSDTTSQVYKDVVEENDLATLYEKKYIRLAPKLNLPEHEEKKNYIIIQVDNFEPNSENPQFRDCTITFSIVCHTDDWDIGDFELRPLKIAGCIDAVLNESRLSGIGRLHFLGCKEFSLSDEFGGYLLMYQAIHGSDDHIASDD